MLNKIDLLPGDEVDNRCQAVVDKLGWQGPVFRISALGGEGTGLVCGQVMDYLEDIRDRESHDPDLVEVENRLQRRMQQEAREKIEQLREQRRTARDSDRDDDDDDGDVEVVYAP